MIGKSGLIARESKTKGHFGGLPFRDFEKSKFLKGRNSQSSLTKSKRGRGKMWTKRLTIVCGRCGHRYRAKDKNGKVVALYKVKRAIELEIVRCPHCLNSKTRGGE